MIASTCSHSCTCAHECNIACHVLQDLHLHSACHCCCRITARSMRKEGLMSTFTAGQCTCSLTFECAIPKQAITAWAGIYASHNKPVPELALSATLAASTDGLQSQLQLAGPKTSSCRLHLVAKAAGGANCCSTCDPCKPTFPVQHPNVSSDHADGTSALTP